MRNNGILKYIHTMNHSIVKYAESLIQKGRSLTEELISLGVEKGKPLFERAQSLGLLIWKDKIGRSVLIIVLAVMAVALLWYRSQTVAVQESAPIFTVKRGEFQLKIIERGEFKALRNVMIASSITANRGKILWIVPEGAYMKKGNLLVKFDKTPFQDEIAKYETELARARAELVQVQEDLKAEKARIEQGLKQAEDEIVLAELVFKNLEKGSGPLKIQKAKFEVQKHKAEYEKLERDYDDFKELVKEGYVSQAELDGIGRKRDEAKTAYEFAQAEYDNLINFEYPTQLESAKARLRAARESYEKLKETAQYTIAGKEAAIHGASANIANAQARLNEAQNDLRHSEIYSPVEGFMIYSPIHLAGELRKVAIGDTVFPTQPFMYIPDTSQMLVDTRIREVDIYKVKPGQEATIRVDAYPDLALLGEVTLVGTLAEGGEKGGGKYFNLQITLKKTDPRLRSGMTVRVEILVDEERDVLMVPVAAVFEKGRRKVSYVVTPQGVEEREILTDKNNEDFAVVLKGLSEGERVLLIEPTRELPSRSSFPRL